MEKKIIKTTSSAMEPSGFSTSKIMGCKFLVFCLILLLSSCTNDGLNKSILEPLTSDELKCNINNDSLFVDFDETVSLARQKIMKCENSNFQQKFGKITYDQMYKYFKLKNDTIFINKYREDHQKKYNYKHQVDSILSYWREYVNQNDIDIANIYYTYPIPDYVRDALEFETAVFNHESRCYTKWTPDENPEVYEYIIDNIIWELIDKNYESFYEYLENTINNKMRNEDPDVYILFEYIKHMNR